jgi:uncharacterized Zn-binding protein involved in type VI secretion
MAQHPIRLGDYTSHGGQVVSATGMQDMYGKPQAVVGDHCTCPIPGHGPCVIVEGAPEITFNGKPTAWQGHKTSCGATLISSLAEVTRKHDSGAAATAGTATASNSKPSSSAQTQFNDKIQLCDDETHEPLANYTFAIKRADGSIEHGTTDAQGFTHEVSHTDSAEALHIYLGDSDQPA